MAARRKGAVTSRQAAVKKVTKPQMKSVPAKKSKVALQKMLKAVQQELALSKKEQAKKKTKSPSKNVAKAKANKKYISTNIVEYGEITGGKKGSRTLSTHLKYDQMNKFGMGVSVVLAKNIAIPSKKNTSVDKNSKKVVAISKTKSHVSVKDKQVNKTVDGLSRMNNSPKPTGALPTFGKLTPTNKNAKSSVRPTSTQNKQFGNVSPTWSVRLKSKGPPPRKGGRFVSAKSKGQSPIAFGMLTSPKSKNETKKTIKTPASSKSMGKSSIAFGKLTSPNSKEQTQKTNKTPVSSKSKGQSPIAFGKLTSPNSKEQTQKTNKTPVSSKSKGQSPIAFGKLSSPKSKDLTKKTIKTPASSKSMGKSPIAFGMLTSPKSKEQTKKTFGTPPSSKSMGKSPIAFGKLTSPKSKAQPPTPVSQFTSPKSKGQPTRSIDTHTSSKSKGQTPKPIGMHTKLKSKGKHRANPNNKSIDLIRLERYLQPKVILTRLSSLDDVSLNDVLEQGKLGDDKFGLIQTLGLIKCPKTAEQLPEVPSVLEDNLTEEDNVSETAGIQVSTFYDSSRSNRKKSKTIKGNKQPLIGPGKIKSKLRIATKDERNRGENNSLHDALESKQKYLQSEKQVTSKTSEDRLLFKATKSIGVGKKLDIIKRSIGGDSETSKLKKKQKSRSKKSSVNDKPTLVDHSAENSVSDANDVDRKENLQIPSKAYDNPGHALEYSTGVRNVKRKRKLQNSVKSSLSDDMDESYYNIQEVCEAVLLNEDNETFKNIIEDISKDSCYDNPEPSIQTVVAKASDLKRKPKPVKFSDDIASDSTEEKVKLKKKKVKINSSEIKQGIKSVKKSNADSSKQRKSVDLVGREVDDQEKTTPKAKTNVARVSVDPNQVDDCDNMSWSSLNMMSFYDKVDKMESAVTNLQLAVSKLKHVQYKQNQRNMLENRYKCKDSNLHEILDDIIEDSSHSEDPNTNDASIIIDLMLQYHIDRKLCLIRD